MQTSNTNLGDSANIFVSNALLGNLERNFPDAQHTAAIYTDSYTGKIRIQASCQTPVPDTEDLSTDWFDVETFDIVDANTAITYTTFNINCNWVRLVSEPQTGSVTKILLRN